MAIDINELRRLTQAALAGPDGISLNWIKLLQDFQQKASPSAISELLDRLEAAESEALEQARLNGMGSEREAALMAKLEAAEKDIAIKEEVIDSLATVIKRLDAQCDAAEKERDALRAENERIDEAMESLLIRCDDSDSAMYGTLSTSFVRDTVRIARGAMEESK